MENSLIFTATTGGVGYITLNDPTKMNAFSKQLAEELLAALNFMWFDSSVRVIVLRGAGGNFSAGGDIKSMKVRVDRLRQGLPLDPDPRENIMRLNKIVALVRTIDKPVVAWIEGAIAGGGLGLAMACDFALAQKTSKFSYAFSGIGLAPDMGAAAALSARVSAPKATELFMLGKRFSGQQAADWGIITQAYDESELENEVNALLEKLAQGPTLAYAVTKSYINRAYYSDLEASMTIEVERQTALSRTNDHMNAIDAFVSKQKPQFHGN